MNDFKKITSFILKFRDDRDWQKFHTPRNLAESLMIESAEVLEHFQWKTDEEISQHLKDNKDEFAYELADVFNYLLLLANASGIDIEKAVQDKQKISARKYPVKKAKGNAKKYTELEKL